MDQDRVIAFDALTSVAKSRTYSNIALNYVINRDNVKNQGFVRELVYGVIKTRKLTDFYIDQLVRKGARSVDQELLVLLEMGVYQILFMDSVPQHSACDETVEIAKQKFKGKSGFINGVLRNFIRKFDTLRQPDDIKDKTARLSIKYSAEKQIVRLFIDQYGYDTAEKMLKSSFETPPLYIHVNTCRTDSESLIAELADFDVRKVDIKGASVLEAQGPALIDTDAFREGKFFVQDVASVNAVAHLDPLPGEILIDVCAAPGGKSFAAACQMENKGVIHAMDYHEKRLSTILKGRDRMGFSIIDTEVHDATEPLEKYVETADKVICDVPCSGLGVIRRKPDIKYKKIEDGIDELIETQYKILEASARYVKPGGVIMYSTCTINKKENVENTERFLLEHTEFQKTDECQLLPGIEDMNGLEDSDGFYYCIMKKRNS